MVLGEDSDIWDGMTMRTIDECLSINEQDDQSVEEFTC